MPLPVSGLVYQFLAAITAAGRILLAVTVFFHEVTPLICEDGVYVITLAVDEDGTGLSVYAEAQEIVVAYLLRYLLVPGLYIFECTGVAVYVGVVGVADDFVRLHIHLDSG